MPVPYRVVSASFLSSPLGPALGHHYGEPSALETSAVEEGEETTGICGIVTCTGGSRTKVMHIRLRDTSMESLQDLRTSRSHNVDWRSSGIVQAHQLTHEQAQAFDPEERVKDPTPLKRPLLFGVFGRCRIFREVILCGKASNTLGRQRSVFEGYANNIRYVRRSVDGAVERIRTQVRMFGHR